jgi:hypothetical protein
MKEQMEVDPLVIILLKELIVPIKMKEQTVVILMVVEDHLMALNFKKKRDVRQIEMSIEDLHGGINDDRSELYGVGLIGQRSDVSGSKSQGNRSSEGAAH